MEVLNCVEQEQLAAQVVAVMDSHFRRPTAEEKNKVLRLASGQITAAADTVFPKSGGEGSL
jgi:hypothetical protein